MEMNKHIDDSLDSEVAVPLLKADNDKLPVHVSYIEVINSSFVRRYLVALLVVLNTCWSLFLVFQTSTHNSSSASVSGATSVPSPLLHLNLKAELRTLSGSIRDDGSTYRQGPSPEVDEAWSRLAFEGYELINVTEVDILALGKDPQTSVRWDQSVDAFPAQIEFAHQVHCLDMVRKEIWGKRYFGNLSIAADDAAVARGEYDARSKDGYYVEGGGGRLSIKGLRKQHRQHTMHCLHILLQNIMCNLDVGIITHDWVQERDQEAMPYPHPLADVSTKKVCRSFEAVADWVHENAVRDGNDKFGKMVAQPGTRVAQRNDSYWP